MRTSAFGSSPLLYCAAAALYCACALTFGAAGVARLGAAAETLAHATPMHTIQLRSNAVINLPY